MSEQEGLRHQIAVHWGAAVIGGVFGLAIAAVGAGALYVRTQPSRELESATSNETRQALESLESRLTATEQESRRKDEQLAAAFAEIQRLQSQNATRTVPATTSEPPIALTVETTPPPAPTQRIEKGNFTFELRGCHRRGEDVRCSLSVINDGNERKSMNLCGASYLIDESGQKPPTRVVFAGGGCGSFHLEPGLPNALEMSASMPNARTLNVVLSDGNWFSFSGTVIFRGVVIDGGA